MRPIVPDTAQHLKAHQLRTLTSPETPRASTAAGVAFALADYLLFYGGAGHGDCGAVVDAESRGRAHLGRRGGHAVRAGT